MAPVRGTGPPRSPHPLLFPPPRLSGRRLRHLGWIGARHAAGLAGSVARILAGRVSGSPAASIAGDRRGAPHPSAAGAAAAQLRMAFQEMGPTFVKLGQLVSSSPGTFPAALVEEMSRLRDAVPPEPWEAVAATLEEELGALRPKFRWVGWKPLAAASIAQVYPATLTDESDVALKVQRRDLVAILRQDLRVLHAFARLADRLVPPLSVANPVGVVEDFAEVLGEELDFTAEARHMDSLRGILSGWPVQIPRVSWELTTPRVLTMEMVRGTRLSDTEAVGRLSFDKVALADTVLGSFLVSALCHGVFHADGHLGNLLVRDDGTLVLLDFGIVGHLDDETRLRTARLVAAFVNRRFDVAARAIAELAEADYVDVNAVFEDLQQIALRHLDHPWGEVPLARLMVDLVRAAHRNGVRIPQGLLLFCKQLLYLDGVGRLLNPGFDVFADGSRFLALLPDEALGA